MARITTYLTAIVFQLGTLGFIDPQLLGCGECQDERDHIPAHLTLVLSNLTAGYINGGLDGLRIISGVSEYCGRLSVDLFRSCLTSWKIALGTDLSWRPALSC